MFARVVFLESVSGTHWITKIQRQNQEQKGKGSYETGYIKNTVHQ